MRNIALTCKNHPDLRWHTKEGSVDTVDLIPGKSAANYNHDQKLRFIGTKDPATRTYLIEHDITECDCPPDDLIIAPEDITHLLWNDGRDLTSEERARIRNQYDGAYDNLGVESKKVQ